MTCGGSFIGMPGMSISIVTSHLPSRRGPCASAAAAMASVAASVTMARSLIRKSSIECGKVIIARTEGAMRNLCWLLIGLAALAFGVGTALAFSGHPFLLPPVGYWRGA